MVFLIGFIPTDVKTDKQKKSFNLNRKTSFFLLLLQEMELSVFLYPLGFLGLLLRFPTTCSLYWESLASDTKHADLVFMVSDWLPLLLTMELAIVLGGEIPAFVILQNPALWSPGPPRIGTAEQK